MVRVAWPWASLPATTSSTCPSIHYSPSPFPLSPPLMTSASPPRTPHLTPGSFAENHKAKMDFIADLYTRPIAIEQDKANEQHYEVPTAFLQLCLGPRMKYSSCEWPNAKSSLADAEDAILASYCVEAKLGRGLRGVGVPKDQEGAVVNGEVGKEGEGLKILDLGCGWGSLGLFLAEHYPLAEITMLSNSRTQKQHIDSVAKEKGFKNVTVITGDVNVFDFEEKEKYVDGST